MISSHNANRGSGLRYIKSEEELSIFSNDRLLYLDVRKMMLSSQSQPVVRPLYNGGRIALQGTHHHLLSMLVDTLTLVYTRIVFF